MPTGVTLADMSRQTRAILGMSLNVAHGVDQEDALREGLRRTQADLWVMHDWPALIRRITDKVAPGQREVDIPEELDFEHVNAVWSRKDELEKWRELDYGIGPEQLNEHDSDAGARADVVRRYMATAQDPHIIEIWPVPVARVDIMFVGRQKLAPLVASTDRCTLDSDLIISTYAAQQLARQGNADAEIQLSKAQSILNRLRGRQGATKRKPFVVQTLLSGGAR